MTISIIAVGTIFWILNIEEVIKGSWSSVIAAVFTVLGVLLALLQWYTQLFPDHPVAPVSPLPYVQSHLVPQIEGLNLGIDEQKGALIVKASKHLRGATIHLCRGFDPGRLKTDAASNIIEREVNGHNMFVGIFPSLEPGNYSVHARSLEYIAKITVYAGQVTEVDWQWQ